MPADPPVSAAAVERVSILEVDEEGRRRREDRLAVEEPLEIRVVTERDGRRERHPVAITMRTPGHDLELAAGFLHAEGVVRERRSIWRIAHCETAEQDAAGNVVEAHLAPGVDFDPERFSRNVYTTSSCGVCGRGSLELLWAAAPARPRGELRLAPAALRSLPRRLARSQRVFSETGGLHAAALCDAGGDIELLREDVGRHNAVDKLVGSLLMGDRLPASDRLLLVSGRASFELVQKAVLAGIPAMVAVGAPSSLAVATAEELGMTLVGFLGEHRFNVYAGAERVGE